MFNGRRNREGRGTGEAERKGNADGTRKLKAACPKRILQEVARDLDILRVPVVSDALHIGTLNCHTLATHHKQPLKVY